MVREVRTLKTWVVLSDIQFPFHDKPVLELVLRFLKRVKPDGVILNGDIVDCYELSTFDRDPIKQARLDKEIDLGEWLMGELAKFIPNGNRWWLGGNHEDRLRRYIWRRTQEFAHLRALEFDKLFKLADYEFQWKPYGQFIRLGKLLVTHGSQVSKHSGWTARAHFEKYGNSVLVGHTHRLGVYYKTNAKGVHAGYENGCLCRLDPEYVQYPDWQQGFSMVQVHPSGWFNVVQIPVLARKRLFYGGEMFE